MIQCAAPNAELEKIAHYMVNKAVSKGSLIRQPCEKAPGTRTDSMLF